ncbi:MAG: phospho-N-acetylmuramoyl-pentapeptide-transferase [Clostridia bacterium]|jgi:phospho-N-acetylmuramoyl-pentapeptide-transferase|nr:phospho-N-acetylmuramoyl-pentapeptide-transferase [Clostridium sp. CAG:571]HJJ06696.1 phospho-N-acetylmuramoyl-pentapeptide-transferase [Clostridiaceae bacterium]HJJ13785.1 phospho-N-acetylmuramoyl-pentapeptide-transferase [Clostridiaceae bacterium]
MEFHIKVVLLSFAISIILGLIIIPILKKLKVGQIERDDGPKSHLKKQGTPTMGGVIIALTIFIVCMGLYVKYSVSEANVAKNILPLLFVTIGFGLVGFVDDFKKLVLKNTKGLKPIYKMLGLLIIAVAYTLFLTNVLKIGTATYIPFLKIYINMPIWLYIPFAIFVLLGTTNAVNLTDGIDGLATTVTTIILAFFTTVGIILGVKEIVLVGATLVGACLGFLLFNLHPAKVFMGDTGSLLLGGAIAGIALYLKMPIILVIVALVPVIETISVMLQVTYYKKTGKRIFKMAPIHHHFELSGWSENKVVSVFSIITLILCVIGINVI